MSDERDQEALEGRVRELEATVESLTSELVDATERIRELEAELDLVGESTSDDSIEETDSWVPAAEDVEEGTSPSTQSKTTDETTDDTTTRDSDDIIVA